MNTKLNVGFVGLGLMGNPMAKNIIKKGFPLFVYNRNPERTKEFAKLGAKVCKSSKEVAENSDVIVTMVTGPKDVRQVCMGRNGIAEGGKKGLIVIDMSTIGPSAAKEIASDLEHFQIDFIDAPVTGSVERATSGTLFIFAGGKKSVFEKSKTVLEAMGTPQYLGPVGSGQAVKLINNLIVGESLAALAEGMLLADAMGFPRKTVAETLKDVPAVSGMMKMKMDNMVKGKFPTAFSMANMRKDLKLALNEKNMPFLKMADKFYKIGMDEGLSEADNSAILEVLAKKN